MKHLTLEQILQIHALVITETGGSIELRDLNRLEAALATQVQSVFGQELYSSALEKSAAIIRAIIGDHPFVDGNKRTGIISGLIFLALNEINLQFKPSEIEDFAVKIATEKLDVRSISLWLRQHTI